MKVRRSWLQAALLALFVAGLLFGGFAGKLSAAAGLVLLMIDGVIFGRRRHLLVRHPELPPRQPNYHRTAYVENGLAGVLRIMTGYNGQVRRLLRSIGRAGAVDDSEK